MNLALNVISLILNFSLFIGAGYLYEMLKTENKRLAHEIRRVEDKLDVLRCKVRDDTYGK